MILMLAILETLLKQPTAPFHEDAVAHTLDQLLQGIPHVSVERDSFGNLLATYRNSDTLEWGFAAHMDHPGWVRSPENNEWVFLGGVPQEYLAQEPPRCFFETPSGEPFAMWDLPAFHMEGDRLYSRACDDLVGCAAIVETLLELARTEAKTSCVGLFTRAEEVGFVGAIELAKSGLLPREVKILSLETSAERPPAKMGDGVIVRVGDRSSIFDPSITAALTEIATSRRIPFQRCLMTGGTCEASAYTLYGYQTGALCVALGNYHNCGPETTIAPEYVSLRDFEGLVSLCVAIAETQTGAAQAPSPLHQRLEANLAKYRPHYRSLHSLV